MTPRVWLRTRSGRTLLSIAAEVTPQRTEMTEKGGFMNSNRELPKRFGSLQLLFAIAALAALAVAAQVSAQKVNSRITSATAGTQVKITHVGIKHVPADSGQSMYIAYCAACHGASAKGDGPAVPALVQKPTDLTMLSSMNNGKFPKDHVRYLLTVTGTSPSHGSADMPIWGKAFRALDNGHPRSSVASLRASNLVNYLETLQAPQAQVAASRDAKNVDQH